MTAVVNCKLQKINVLHFITEAIKAHLNNIKAPLLIPDAFY